MKKNSISQKPVAGFTLVEMLVTTAIVGLVSAIAIPSWLAFVNQQRLSEAQDKVLTVLRDSQANAKRQEGTWQACFRDYNNQVWSAIQSVPINSNTDCSNPSTNWQPLIGADSQIITINQTNSNLFPTSNASPPSSTLPPGYYEVQFTPKGLVDNSVGGNPPQKITITLRNQANNSQGCIFVETLLGAVRTDKGNNCKLSS